MGRHFGRSNITATMYRFYSKYSSLSWDEHGATTFANYWQKRWDTMSCNLRYCCHGGERQHGNETLFLPLSRYSSTVLADLFWIMLHLGIVVGREQERIALVSRTICQLVRDAKTDDPCGDRRFRVLYICNMYTHEKNIYIYIYIYTYIQQPLPVAAVQQRCSTLQFESSFHTSIEVCRTYISKQHQHDDLFCHGTSPVFRWRFEPVWLQDLSLPRAASIAIAGSF